MATTDIPLSVFNEGFWMNHHGDIAFTLHVDFRLLNDRLPIGAVVKLCEGKYAIEERKTIKLARPRHFRHEGETLIYDVNEARATREIAGGNGESPVSQEAARQLDEQIDRIAKSHGWPTSSSDSSRGAADSRTTQHTLDWGKELLLFCTATEPSSATDRKKLVDSLDPNYDHESYIPSPRAFAQALAAVYVEHFGPVPKGNGKMTHAIDGLHFGETSHGSVLVAHGPVLYVDDPHSVCEAAILLVRGTAGMLLPVFVKSTEYKAQMEYRFALFDSRRSDTEFDIMPATPALIAAIDPESRSMGPMAVPPYE